MTVSVFFNDTATTEIYTLSLHDALPILHLGTREDGAAVGVVDDHLAIAPARVALDPRAQEVAPDVEAFDQAEKAPDRKSTRLNSSHANISYAVFCLKKKKLLHSHHSHIT